jgi:hypothetical protein
MRRSLALPALALAATLALSGCAASDDEGGDAGATAAGADGESAGNGEDAEEADEPAELPGGGRTLFPDRRMVAFYGNGESEALGILGETSPEQAAQDLVEAAEPFATPERPVLPTFELIVTVAQQSPGPDGTYSVATSPDVVQTYLDAVREIDGYLVLDFQPGQSEFLPQVQEFEEFLLEPDVGVALDPEWRMDPGEAPGDSIGSVDASEINAVSEYLAELVEANDLPEKLLILHHFRLDMIEGREQVQNPEGIAVTWHADGFGDQQLKTEVFEVIRPPDEFPIGFKLFYDEDTNLFTPQETIDRFDPDFISYQ